MCFGLKYGQSLKNRIKTFVFVVTYRIFFLNENCLLYIHLKKYNRDKADKTILFDTKQKAALRAAFFLLLQTAAAFG